MLFIHVKSLFLQIMVEKKSLFYLKFYERQIIVKIVGIRQDYFCTELAYLFIFILISINHIESKLIICLLTLRS